MSRWESKAVELPCPLHEIMERINKEGQDRWQFCGTFGTMGQNRLCVDPLSTSVFGNVLFGIFQREILDDLIPSGEETLQFSAEVLSALRKKFKALVEELSSLTTPPDEPRTRFPPSDKLPPDF